MILSAILYSMLLLREPHAHSAEESPRISSKLGRRRYTALFYNDESRTARDRQPHSSANRRANES